MNEPVCPECGRPRPTGALHGLCPACLFGLGEKAASTVVEPSIVGVEGGSVQAFETSTALSERIGRYRLLEIIGEGGFGTVWMAEQTEPVRRKVALKIIKLGMDTRQVVARFEAERQALALMDHPNIARVFDAGATDAGRPYFVMELVRGVPITEFCDARQLNTRERLELLIPVCQAVQHAHQKGVIHRDLKPSNILVTEQDGRAVPKIIDFGVAKAVEEPLTDNTLFTRFHQFLGTPAYMSPEQAGLGGLDVDTRSDIYSLGVLLYELLTGQPPLDPMQLRDPNHEVVLRTIREVEPPKPSTRLRQTQAANRVRPQANQKPGVRSQGSEIDSDLDWIVLKALEKDRARRYETANGLAADVQRYLDNEPIAARPPGSIYRLSKLARRHKLPVTAAGAVVAALIVGLIATYLQAMRAERNLASARLNAYVREVNVAQQALAENNLARALELLDRQRPQAGEKVDLRGFEWRYLWQECQSAETTCFDDESAEAIDFSKDGRWLAYGGASKVVVREASSHRSVALLATPVVSLSFSADGLLLATAGWADVRLWDTRTWREVRQLTGAGNVVLFSPDGNWLLTGQADGERLVLWDRASWKPVATCPSNPEFNYHVRNGVAFSPEGKQLVTLSVDFSMEKPSGFRFWGIPSLDLVGELFPARMPLACAAFEPSGKHLLTGTWDGRLSVWDITEPEPQMLYSLQEHSTHIARIAVASEGECIATVGEDQTLNIWQRGTYRHLARLRGHTNQINSLAISPDGQTIVTGSGRDGVTRVWRTDRFDASELSNVGSWIAGFTSDSQTLVLGPRRGDSRWQLVGGLNATVLIPSNSISALDLRNRPFDVYGDKPLGMLGRSNGLVELWDLSAGRQVDSWPAETDEITFVRLSPDGRRVTTGSAAGHLRIWRVSDHSPVAEFIAGRGPVRAIAYSPDGRVLAAACQESPIQFWDAASCRSLPAAGEQRGICWIEFSPDGGTVAVANLSGGVHLYDARSRALLAELRGHVMGVLRASFFPDGKTLATGSLDGRVKLWNLATCQELLTLTVPLGGTFHSLAIAPNGCTLAVGYLGSPGHHVLLYRAPSLEERAEREPDAVRWFRP